MLNAERQRARKLELTVEASATLKEQLSRADQQSAQALQQLRTALDTETKHCHELHR